jgi:DNA-binding NarL/FixJ family response regulator
MIRLLLVEDHATLRTSLAFVLNKRKDMRVVAEAGSLAETDAIDIPIDVALVDLDLPDGNGLSLVSSLREINPLAAVIIVTGSKDRMQYARAIGQGAAGVLYKACSIDNIVSAILDAHWGRPIHRQEEILEFLSILRQDHENSAQSNRLATALTPRECDLLRALAEGLTDREIADRLFISVRTVQSHMMNLLDKLDAQSRLQALIIAVRNGLVRIDVDC